MKSGVRETTLAPFLVMVADIPDPAARAYESRVTPAATEVVWDPAPEVRVTVQEEVAKMRA